MTLQWIHSYNAIQTNEVYGELEMRLETDTVKLHHMKLSKLDECSSSHIMIGNNTPNNQH